MLHRRGLLSALGSAALLGPDGARAQPAGKVARIGVVAIGGATSDMAGALPPHSNTRAFLRGMAELGYAYGRDFVTEPCGVDRLSALSELVALKPDVIVATGGGAVLPTLQKATSTIPVVMTAAPDPVNQGYVQSLARSGNNFTGMSLQSRELTGKRLQLLKELVPDAGSVAIFWDPTNADLWQRAQATGPALGWKPVSVEIRNPSEIGTAFRRAVDSGARALLVPASVVLLSHAREVVGLAAESRLPAIYELRPYVDAGGLLSYGADIEAIWRRAASYVDKLLKGANPAALPIEQPTAFELVINARTAKALGLSIPPAVLIRADQVID